MQTPALAATSTVSVTVRHRVRTATFRQDCVGWITSGSKRLSGSRARFDLRADDVFLVARTTQWDVVNDPQPGGRYVARIVAFTPELIEQFHARFPQFAAQPCVVHAARTRADAPFQSTFARVAEALESPDTSAAMREHRLMELLLLLAERGWVFAAGLHIGWADKIHRLVGQRTDQTWANEDIAQLLHVSVRTLQRKLALEDTSIRQCLRDARMDTALGMLQTTPWPVADIARRCGYASHSRFTAAFRRHFGFAPSTLRPSASGVAAIPD